MTHLLIEGVLACVTLAVGIRAFRTHRQAQTQKRVHDAQIAAAQAHAVELEQKNAVLAKQLQPPERRPEPQERLLAAAAERIGTSDSSIDYRALGELTGCAMVESQVHYEALLRCDYLSEIDRIYRKAILTEAGKAYVMRYKLFSAK